MKKNGLFLWAGKRSRVVELLLSPPIANDGLMVCRRSSSLESARGAERGWRVQRATESLHSCLLSFGPGQLGSPGLPAIQRHLAKPVINSGNGQPATTPDEETSRILPIAMNSRFLPCRREPSGCSSRPLVRLMHCDHCTKKQRGFGHIVRLRLPMVVNCTRTFHVFKRAGGSSCPNAVELSLGRRSFDTRNPGFMRFSGPRGSKG